MKRHLLLLITAVFFSTASVFAQGGNTGPLTWNLSGNTLTISGNGAMPDYEWSESPWHDYAHNIATVIIGNGVTCIGIYAFCDCYILTAITIPNSVTTIREYAFSFCEVLTLITIPNGVTTIENNAFNNCHALTSITIPNSVTTIETNVFLNCNTLTSITVENDNPNYSSDNGVLFNKDKTTLVCCPEGKTGNYDIPNDVTTIEHYGFYFCRALTSITIPNSVTTIGIAAFSTCKLLTSITIPNGVTTIDSWTFLGCTNLASITIPNSVTTIGHMAFSNCQSLTLITNFNLVPANIYSNAFVGTDQSACTLKVFSSAVSVYENTEVWNEFNIVGFCSVNVSVNNDEYGTATGGGYYDENATATITATAYTGYKFVNWTKNGIVVSTNNPYTFTVTEDIELVANFEEDEVETYLVNVGVNNEEYGTVSGGGIYEENETATVTATANDNYKFIKWAKDGVEISTDNPYSFTVIEDIELIAIFEEEVGIENIEISTVQIYPNPTNGELRIESGELKIENIVIYDIFGKTQKIESWKTKSTIDISHLPAGIYFVKISTEVGEVTRKVLKE